MRAFGDYADDGTSSALKKRDHKDATDLIVFDDQGGAVMREETSGKAPTLRKHVKGHQPLVLAGTLDKKSCSANRGCQSNETDFLVPSYSLTLANTNRNDPWHKKELAQTLDTWGAQGVNQIGVRRLTPIECERLQGFPDGWTDEQADTHRYQQLGNAVCVNVAEWIGKRIVEAEA